jgi:hypothetical protein
MAPHNFEKKERAKDFAKKRRKQGYDCSMYKKKKGYGVSVTRD